MQMRWASRRTRADGQPNAVALGHGQAYLGALNPGELLEVTMVDFNPPGIQGVERTLLQGHRQVTGTRYSASPFVPTVLNPL